MDDGQSTFRHYSGLGETCGKMVVSVRTPVLNILDAIWVSPNSLSGYPAAATYKANQLAASQDPLALDYWTAKNILYPIDRNANHHPDNATIANWMNAAQDIIKGRGGLFRPQDGILARRLKYAKGVLVRNFQRTPEYFSLSGQKGGRRFSERF